MDITAAFTPQWLYFQIVVIVIADVYIMETLVIVHERIKALGIFYDNTLLCFPMK